MSRVKKLASLTFVTVLAVTLIVGVTPLVLADQDGDKGSFDILVFENGNWQLQGELSFSDYETLELPLDNDAGKVSIKLVQRGHDGAYVDYVALQKDFVTYLPAGAINVNSNTNILNKIISPEYDVCDGWDSTLEIVWDDVPANATLIMRAMEEDLGMGHGAPLYYPNILCGEMLAYTLANDSSITVDGVLGETTEPAFSVFWQPDTAHPDGYTYGWLHSGKDYLYAAVEVTADNTLDEEDWGALYVMVDGELKEFRILSDDNQWGNSGFQYTPSVVYEHRIYEFQIPLSEINACIGDEIDYGFGCYGTAAVDPYEVWVDDDWVGLSFGNPADGHTFGIDAFAAIQDGIDAVHEDGTVHVREGDYGEHVAIGDKSLTLQSTDGWQNTTIDPDGYVVWIWGDADVTVQGFEITGGSNGIFITEVDSTVNILDCFIHDNAYNGIAVIDGGDLLHIEGNIICQNGAAGEGCGINIQQAWTTVNILDNIIGGWTYYPEDYSESGPAHRYDGNRDEAIYIYQLGLGETATVNIKGNKISENAVVTADTGIDIAFLYGVVTIADNDIGAWEDNHGNSYLGNGGQGILVSNVYSGAELTIGPDNSIKENTSHGIDISLGQLDSSIEIHHNVVDDNGPWVCGCGIKLGSGGVCGAIVSDNIITNHHKGVYLDQYSTQNTIQDNSIRNNGDGVWIEGDDNQIIRNDILNNTAAPASGIHLTSTAEGNVIHCNNIVGNSPYGVSYEIIYDNFHDAMYSQNGDEAVDATGNWWGCIEGPGAAGCDLVFGNVIYDPWLPDEFQYCRECGGTPRPPPGVPTVNHWGIAAMITVFAGLLVWRMRRRQTISLKRR